MREVRAVLIGTKIVPVRIDLNVVEEIEERYGTVQKFEQELLGWRFARGEDGKYIRDEEGNPKVEYTKPSVSALIWILPLMVNEGLRTLARRNGAPCEPMDPEEVIQECEVDPDYLYEIVWEELQRCRAVKKPMPSGIRER